VPRRILVVVWQGVRSRPSLATAVPIRSACRWGIRRGALPIAHLQATNDPDHSGSLRLTDRAEGSARIALAVAGPSRRHGAGPNHQQVTLEVFAGRILLRENRLAPRPTIGSRTLAARAFQAVNLAGHASR